MSFAIMGTNTVATLCFVRKDNMLLLGYKKRGFGVNLWNGFGGKVHAGESIENAARRELQEEIGLTAYDCVKKGMLHFLFTDTGNTIEVHVFEIMSYSGIPVETEEMRPQWFSLDTIPYHEMWIDDQYWLPVFLENKLFIGNFTFNNLTTLSSYNVEIVKKLPA